MSDEAQGLSGRSVRRVGDRKVWGDWYGGPNYATGEREEFSSITHARQVMRSRIEGHDPISGTHTPLVVDSEMHLHDSAESEYPFTSLKQTKRGIRREET